MTKRVIVALSALGCVLMTPVGGHAQRFELTAPPRERPHARDVAPQEPARSITPGFLAPLSTKTETGQAGLAGSTAPEVPVGLRRPTDSPGWFGFGFAVEWGAAANRTRPN